MKKGEENQQLSEAVHTIKNKILEEEIFSQKFMVQQAGNITTSNLNFSFVRDRSEIGEFFLDIKSASSTAKTDSTKATTEARRTKKRIRIVDIEAIEPTQGIKFKLTYHARPTIYDQFSWKQDKTLKTEYYSSRHIA